MGSNSKLSSLSSMTFSICVGTSDWLYSGFSHPPFTVGPNGKHRTFHLRLGSHIWECGNTVFDPRLVEFAKGKPVDCRTECIYWEKLCIWVDLSGSTLCCSRIDFILVSTQHLGGRKTPSLSHCFLPSKVNQVFFLSLIHLFIFLKQTSI